mmetsp:Transcript_87053/g.174161  ORF Transcript_87053/g.174161 Transcript_87053/m.174161 type:complete len:207 (+) Transcript_87053:17-637(+)
MVPSSAPSSLCMVRISSRSSSNSSTNTFRSASNCLSISMSRWSCSLISLSMCPTCAWYAAVCWSNAKSWLSTRRAMMPSFRRTASSCRDCSTPISFCSSLSFSSRISFRIASITTRWLRRVRPASSEALSFTALSASQANIRFAACSCSHLILAAMSSDIPAFDFERPLTALPAVAPPRRGTVTSRVDPGPIPRLLNVWSDSNRPP